MKAKWVSRDEGSEYINVWYTKPIMHGGSAYDIDAIDTVYPELLSALGFRVPAEGECIKLERVEE